MRKSHCCRKEIVAQVGQMAEAYIELAAVPAPDKANDMPFPSPIRRSTKALNKVGTCSCWNFGLPTDSPKSFALHITSYMYMYAT
jgi:hypothetical protein